MDNQQQDYISDRLNVLKLRFIERLRGELAYLSGFADQVRKGHVDELALNDCRQRLHKLAGSAGTFGFPSLGEFARDLEKRLKREQKALAKGSDAQFDFLPVDENVADQLELLIGIADLDNPLSTERERSAQADEELVSHGMQVRLIVVLDATDQLESLPDELQKYGFSVETIESREGVVKASGTDPGNAAAVLCSDASIESVARWLEAHPRGAYQPPAPT